MAGDDAAAHALAVPLALPHAVSPAALHACARCRARRRERGGVRAAGSARCKAWGLQGPELTAAACETACAPCPAGCRLSAACSTLAVPNPGSAAWACRPGTGLRLRAGCSLHAHCRPWDASCARRRCLPRIPRKDGATSWAIIASLGCPSARTAQRRPLSTLQQTAACAAVAPALLELRAFKVRSRTLRHHQLHAILRENTLLHREALLVLSAQDLQDVASELLTDILAIHLSREPLVVERAPVGSEGVELRRASQTDLLHCVRAANAGVRAAGQSGAAHSFFSSSISMSFCLPVDGLAMLSCAAHGRQHTCEPSCGRSSARAGAGDGPPSCWKPRLSAPQLVEGT